MLIDLEELIHDAEAELPPAQLSVVKALVAIAERLAWQSK